MATVPTHPMNDEWFHSGRGSPWFSPSFVRRAVLMRWIWVINTIRADGTWGLTTAHVTDDFGNLVPVNYIYASVAGAKDAT